MNAGHIMNTGAPGTLLFLVCSVVLGTVAPALAQDAKPYARVMVDTTIIRSGPASTYRSIYVGERGEVFPVISRSSRGYWFQVELPDGTSGWVLGSTVFVHELGEGEHDRFLPEVFAPPPLRSATGELAVSAGLLGETFGFQSGGGFMAIRPTFYLAPEFGLEASLAASIAEGGRLFFGTVGGLVNVFPNWPIVPYAVAGGGYAISDPNADTFLLESGNTAVLYGGGGLRFGFRYRLILRVEARSYAFFQPDKYVAQEELSGGITVFF